MRTVGKKQLLDGIVCRLLRRTEHDRVRRGVLTEGRVRISYILGAQLLQNSLIDQCANMGTAHRRQRADELGIGRAYVAKIPKYMLLPLAAQLAFFTDQKLRRFGIDRQTVRFTVTDVLLFFYKAGRGNGAHCLAKGTKGILLQKKT